MIYNLNTDVIANLAGFKSLKARLLVFDATFVYIIITYYVYIILNCETDCFELLL